MWTTSAPLVTFLATPGARLFPFSRHLARPSDLPAFLFFLMPSLRGKFRTSSAPACHESA